MAQDRPTLLTESSDLNLAKIETRAPKSLTKEEAKAQTAALGERMEQLFDLLFAAGKHSLLIVLQGMDTSGKDGTIRHILRFTHAQSCRVASFKVPTPEELGHDFLWRVHRQTPGRGEIVVFNRSHYEDVLVVRVKNLAPQEVWSRRYDHIRHFERLLADEGTLILKIFLHISPEEQEERLLAREQEVEKAWKLNVGDWKERAFWNDYQAAYADAIGKTATAQAPWLIVPADQKWYRDLVVTQAIVDRLEPLVAAWEASLAELASEAKAELAAYRAEHPLPAKK